MMVVRALDWVWARLGFTTAKFSERSVVKRVMMATTTMKLEMEPETCAVCGNSGELATPEEYDASAPPMQTPLRAMLLQLSNNKTLPSGRLCMNCIQRTIESYEFSSVLSNRTAPPLSEKIRALRRKLHELTQKIDVFIVVGGAGGAGSGNGTEYSEDDIIMVERDALAAAAAADDEDLERAHNARGDAVYQCSVCPLSFQRVSEYRAHAAAHPAGAVHSCWTCGAQFAERGALHEHARAHHRHALADSLHCHLCDNAFQSAAEMRSHEATCPPICRACGAHFPDRPSLATHAASDHGRGTQPPLLCPACFAVCPSEDALSAHLLKHRQAKQFVCGYDGCILRFGTRSNLMAHIRKCHSDQTPVQAEQPAAQETTVQQQPSTTCDECGRTFGSVAAMKRHARVHRNRAAPTAQHVQQEETGGEILMQLDGDETEPEVEYLEEALDEDLDFRPQ